MTSASPSLIEIRDLDGVRVLALAGPRLNTLTRPLRTSIIQALDDAELDPGVIAVVLIGRDGTFSAGADLAEFDSGAGLAEPSLHHTINGFLDRMRTPVVAAVDGMALGGGFELALSAHYRVVTDNATLGLPETRFGFIPGAGGTQRLPRLVAVDYALAAILDGAHLSRDCLEDSALVDQWATSETLLDTAVEFARNIAGEAVPRVRDREFGDQYTDALLENAAHRARRRSHQPAVELSVIGAMSVGRTSFDAGITEEFRAFQELAATPSASAARHVFLAERRVGRPASRTSPPSSVGVVGAGMMGRGIALALLMAGIRVSITDTSPDARDAALDAVRAEATRAGLPDPTPLLTVAENIAGLGSVELVIEAVIESPDVKAAVFADVAAWHPTAVIASNTSGLNLDELAAGLPDPSALIGLHFFAPAHVMSVVEVVRTDVAKDAAVDAGLALVRALGKLPVQSRVGPGFIGNRIFDRYLASALNMVAAGADPKDVDRQLVAWGMRMGPFATLDLIGNDVIWHARTATQHAEAGWALVGDLVARGALGRKSGAGWYDYAAGPAPRWRSGVGTVDPAVIEGTIYPMVDEGVRVLVDGIATRPGDIDVLFLRGYGFPAQHGGPMWFGDTAGPANVVRILSRAGSSREPHERLIQLARQGDTIDGTEDWK